MNKNRCKIPNCNNLTSSETNKNNRYSKLYCEQHVKGVDYICKECKKICISSASDYMKSIKNTGSPPRYCRKCAVTLLNKSPAMREQARILGNYCKNNNIGAFSEEAKKLALKNRTSPEACKLREKTKRKNGFYDINGGYYKGLELRRKNGSLQKWIDSGQTKEARRKQNITKWKNMTKEEKEIRLNRLNSGAKFNRINFYSSKLQLIDFKYINKPLSLKDIDPLNNIPGVWAVWASDNKCLDVCQTINIGSEMLGWIRNYNACRGKSDEELIKMNKKYQNYNRKKKRDIAEYCSRLNSKPIFKLVAIKIKDKNKREDIEAQYAHDNKALFWSPAPGQKLTKIS